MVEKRSGCQCELERLVELSRVLRATMIERLIRVASILRAMSEEREEQARADRNRERSQEAHWRAAKAGAQEEDGPSEDPRPHDQEDWENEGGALARGTGLPHRDEKG
jgi:hypothetical protein